MGGLWAVPTGQQQGPPKAKSNEGSSYGLCCVFYTWLFSGLFCISPSTCGPMLPGSTTQSPRMVLQC